MAFGAISSSKLISNCSNRLIIPTAGVFCAPMPLVYILALSLLAIGMTACSGLNPNETASASNASLSQTSCTAIMSACALANKSVRPRSLCS